MTKERLKSYLVGISHTVSKEMAGSSHTPACCLSNLRSSIKAGKKQPRVWLQYVCSVSEVLLYSSFDAPLVLLWCSYGGLRLKMAGRELKQTSNAHTGHSK